MIGARPMERGDATVSIFCCIDVMAGAILPAQHRQVGVAPAHGLSRWDIVAPFDSLGSAYRLILCGHNLLN